MMMATVTPINPDPQTKLDFALAYARLGWHVFPCHYIEPDTHRCSCGKTDCKSPAKHPFSQLVPRGQDHATTDEATIRSWWGRQPEANIGIFLAPSGLMAIDIDPRNGGWDTIDALEAQHGAIASDVTQFTGGGGEHRIFSLPLNAGTLPGKLGPGVDVKINGYIMAEPSNHISGCVYGWEASSNPIDGIVPSPLPDWLRGQFSQNSSKYTLPDCPTKPLSQQDREDLLSALQHISSDDRDTWVQVGMALHSTQSGSEAFALWDAWSQASAKYDAADQTRVWHSFRNRGLSGVTKATIFKMAQDNEWKNARSKVDSPDPRLEQFAGKSAPNFGFSRVDSLEIKEIDWIVDGYLESDSLDLIFGEPGCGKSFVSIDLACSVATGMSWHGHKVKQGMVIYIAGEGHNGLARRFRGWEKLHGTSLDGVPLYKSHRAAQLFDQKSALDVAEAVHQISEAEGHPPKLIIVDTVARNMGGDENSTQDMNLFIEHLDSLLRHPYKAAVLCIHHSGKASPGQARGSTALRGALDAEYQVEMDPSSKMIVFANRKMKDGEVPPEKRFSISQIGLGVSDSEGEEIMGAALQTVDISGLIEQANRAYVHLGKNQRKAIIALESIIFARTRDGENSPITLDDWRDSSVEQGLNRFQFRDAKDALIAKKRVVVNADGTVKTTYEMEDRA